VTRAIPTSRTISATPIAKPASSISLSGTISALQLNPRHRGAHEYAGEAYLLVNNLAK
jgi:hypothetical protein